MVTITEATLNKNYVKQGGVAWHSEEYEWGGEAFLALKLLNK